MTVDAVGRHLFLVLFVDERDRAHGCWQDAVKGSQDEAKEPWTEIQLDGDTSLDWGPRLWERIIDVYQMNTERDQFRILLCSDRVLEKVAFPGLKRGWEWKHLNELLESLSRVLPPSEKTGVSRWYINGTELRGRYAKQFPIAADPRQKQKHLYTFPYFEIPLQAEGTTPLSVIINDLEKKELDQKRT